MASDRRAFLLQPLCEVTPSLALSEGACGGIYQCTYAASGNVLLRCRQDQRRLLFYHHCRLCNKCRFIFQKLIRWNDPCCISLMKCHKGTCQCPCVTPGKSGVPHTGSLWQETAAAFWQSLSFWRLHLPTPSDLCCPPSRKSTSGTSGLLTPLVSHPRFCRSPYMSAGRSKQHLYLPDKGPWVCLVIFQQSCRLRR